MSPHRPRRTRILALQALYQLDSGRAWEEVSAFLGEPGQPVGQAALTLVEAIWAGRATLDETLADHLQDWSVARLGTVERAVLRLALYELLYEPEVPVAVVIDEAVELVKRFASERSGALVNAVLDKAKVLRDERSKAGGPAGPSTGSGPRAAPRG